MSYRSYCKECEKPVTASWASKNKTKRAASTKKYRESHKEEVKAQKKNWKVKNTEKHNSYIKKSKSKDKGKYSALKAKRKAIKKQACPAWLTKAQYEEIADIYRQAKELEAIFFNRKFHVDHIIPLQGKDVCGLHVPWNLQILTAEENMAKGNRLK